MSAQAGRSRIGLPLLAGLLAIAAAITGSASIITRSETSGASTNRGSAGVNVRPGAERVPPAVPSGGNVRNKTSCTGCGVVESVSRTDRRENASDLRHQIVVRFGDGSRHVFDETTPRTLRPGERVRVIAGVDLPLQ